MENENLELMETENTDAIEMYPEESESNRLGLGMVIGAILTGATIASVKKVKKLITNHKAKKEAEDEDIIEEICEEVEDEIEEEPDKKPKSKK